MVTYADPGREINEAEHRSKAEEVTTAMGIRKSHTLKTRSPRLDEALNIVPRTEMASVHNY